MKITNHLYGGTVDIVFESFRHQYTCEGRVIPGCTTALGILSKPALLYWAANMASDYWRDNIKPGHSLYGRYLWKRTSLSMHEKSWLRKIAKGVYGRDLTTDEMKNFDPESLVGKNVDVFTEQSPSKDGTKIFSNIISFTKASPKGCIGNDLKPFNFEEAKAKSAERKAGIEKSSTPLPTSEKGAECGQLADRGRVSALLARTFLPGGRRRPGGGRLRPVEGGIHGVARGGRTAQLRHHVKVAG